MSEQIRREEGDFVALALVTDTPELKQTKQF